MIERNNFKQYLEKEVKELEELRAKVQASLENAPDGKLHVKQKKNKNTEFYLFKDKKRIYIPQNEKELITGLAQKEYDDSALEIIDKRLFYGEKMMNQYATSLDAIYENLADAKKELIETAIPQREEFIREWYRKYPGNQNSIPINTGIYAERGEEVRSKSEKIIADKFLKFDVPYIYEPKFMLGNKIICADFFLLNVRLLKTYAYEHFGLMGDPVYSERVCEKISLYESNGFMPGENFLFTMESQSHPLDTRLIDNMIIKYLK